MSRIRSTAASALAALAVSACATSTPYAPTSNQSRYGFNETQIEANRWAVSFSGNSLTDLKTVETYLLYRAAELTRNSGYDYFVIVDRKVDQDTDYRGTNMNRYAFNPAFSYQFYHPRFGWRYYYDPFFDDVTLREVTKYEAIAEIVMGQGPKPAGNVRAYDADDVLMRLSGQIQRPSPN